MASRSSTWTVLFTDLASSTELRSRIGERAFDGLRSRHDSLLRDSVTEHRGEVVKFLGDGVMAAFPGAAESVAAAVAIQQAFHRWQEADASVAETGIRVGISIGDAVRSESDLHGTVAVEAARLCAAAQPGQILCSELVRLVSGSRGDHRFESLGGLVLKGLGRPLPSCEVLWEPAASPPPPVGGSAVRLPFVGRGREAALFAEMLSAASQGRGSLLIVEGEQGSGKSRLLEEFVSRASAAETAVLMSRAFETEGTPPYWMWRAPLDQLAHLPDGRVANVLLGLLSSPQLSAVREGRRSSRGQASNSLAVFDALARLLTEVADIRPTVLLLDDLHWADQASLEFLVYLSRVMAPHGLVVVGTSCPNVGPRVADDQLAEAARATSSLRIALPPLGVEDVAGLLAADAVGVDASARRLVDGTGGNAFLVTELVRLTDGRPPPEAALPVPPSVRAVVARRSSALPPGVMPVLEAASVLGRSGRLDVLAEVTGENSARLADEVQHAINVGLLEATDGALFSFRHALVRQTLADRLAPARRAELHLAAARCLQARNAVDDLWGIAHHLTVAAGVHGELREEALESWRTAARRAAAMSAHADAAAHLAQAVKLSSEHDRPRLLVELGFSTLRAGRPAEALGRFASAARSSLDPEVVARAAIGYEDAYLAAGGMRLQTADPSIELLEAALAAQPPGSALEGALAASLARASWYSGDSLAAATWLNRAEQACDGTDGDAAMRIAFARRVLSGAPGDAAALAGSCSTLIDTAIRIERRDIVLDALRQRILALVELGTLDEADEEIDRFDRLVHQWGEVLYLPYAPLLRAMRMLQRGELTTARRLNRRAVELSEQVDSLHLGQLALMQRFSLARWCGATVRFADELMRHAGRTGSGPIWYLAAALADAENEQPARARLRLHQGLGSNGVERIPRNEFWLFAMGCASLAAHRLADAESAAILYQELLPYRAFLVGNVAPIVGPVAHVAGLAAATAGFPALALELLIDARRRVEELDCRPWLVECLRGEAEVLRHLGRDGEPSRRRAEELAASLAMVGGAAAPGSAQGLASLTARERDVLALIAAGRSNHEISAELYISYRTAKTHVSHILHKIGARDRAEAAMAAQQAGLGRS